MGSCARGEARLADAGNLSLSLEALSTYDSREEFKADYPELEEEDIRQALGYAAAMLADETVEMKTAS